MIKIDNLHKNYKKLEVLKGISITINDGEIYGIIGRSGAGKSTLLRCVNGLENFDSGSIYVDGQPVNPRNRKEIKLLRKNMGMIFQGFNLLERLDVYDNVALPLKFWGIKKNSPVARERIMKLIRLVGLEDKIHSKPRELSGGQKQRVAIARALVLNPRFLLCDEATSALDPEITKEILSIIEKINKELGLTVIIVTHQMEVVKQVCKRVAFLSEGKVLEEGRPEEMFVKPKSQEIRSFLREESAKLPAVGTNVQLYFYGPGAEQPVITMMAKDLGIDFSIMWGKLEDFRENVYGSLVINVQDGDTEKVFRYLNEHHVEWEVIK